MQLNDEGKLLSCAQFRDTEGMRETCGIRSRGERCFAPKYPNGLLEEVRGLWLVVSGKCKDE